MESRWILATVLTSPIRLPTPSGRLAQTNALHVHGRGPGCSNGSLHSGHIYIYIRDLDPQSSFEQFPKDRGI